MSPRGGHRGRHGSARIESARAGGSQGHLPVLLAEVVAALAPVEGGTYIDGTFGAGGYTRAILEAADCRVVALDRDPAAIAAGAGLVRAFAPRLELRQMPFGRLLDETGPAARGSVDGVVLDLGVSSMQLDDAARGFSFQADGPLDMRMYAAGQEPPGEDGPTAAEIVNTYEEALLADILYDLGEERRSRAIAAAIVRARRVRLFTRTAELVAVVESVLGRGRPDGRHPATRTFQALRLLVNDELGELVRGLSAAEHLLKPAGRLVVVTFHSLEDRIVKRFLAARSARTPAGSRHLPSVAPPGPASFRIVNPKPICPSEEEIARNPRARSAKLRAAERTGAQVWPFDPASAGLPPVLLR